MHINIYTSDNRNIAYIYINQIIIIIFEKVKNKIKKHFFLKFLHICRIDKYNTTLQYMKTLTTNMDINEEKKT